MKLRFSALILLVASAFVAPKTARAQAGQDHSLSVIADQIVVTMRPSADSATSLSRIAGRFGRVFVSDPRHHAYRLLLTRGAKAQAAIASLQHDPAVQSARRYSPRPQRIVGNMTSARNITRTIRNLEAQARERHEEADEDHAKPPATLRQHVDLRTAAHFKPRAERDAGTDYLRAYRYWYQQRAFPFDSIPPNGYARAIQQRSKLKASPLGRKRSTAVGTESIGGAWEFTGPKNLDVPYRIYWGPRAVSGRVNAVAYDTKNPGTYYVGAAGGGLWVTTDSGANWTPLGDAWTFLQVSSIAVDPNDSQTIYVGTGDFDGFGVYSFGLQKTTDGGVTWSTLGAAQFGGSAISKIFVDPNDSNSVTIATGRGFGWGNSFVWHSSDGGLSWAQAINVPSNWQDLDLGVKSLKNQQFMYAVGEDQQFWRSPDRGKNWFQAASPAAAGPVNVAASQTDFATVYVISAADSKVYKSVDAGGNWVDVTQGLDDWNQSPYDMHITAAAGLDEVGLPEDIVYIGLIDLFQAPDEFSPFRSIGGPTESWNALTHNDQHALQLNPLDPTEALVGNDGGAYRMKWTVQGDTFAFDTLNANLGITQFYHGAWHPTDPSIMLGGTQDNATPVSTGDMDNWSNVAGGDGGGVAINPDQPAIQYATIYGAQVIRTGDQWNTSQDISPNATGDNLPFVTTIYIDPNNSNLLYLGTNFLWQWNDKTGVWTGHIGNQALTGGIITSISIFPGDRDRIYTGGSDGQIWMSTDLVSFHQITGPSSGLPARSITTVDVNPNDKDDLLVTVSGFGTGHVWRCTDTRGFPPVFVDVSGTGADQLPDVPVNALTRDPWNPDNTWYVATDIGVFMTNDAGLTWTNATNPLGLPNVQVNDIKAIKGTAYLNVATYGRGMWRIGMLPDVAQIDTLTIDPNTVADGASSTGTVKLKYPAPPGGTTINLTTSDAVNTTIPASITIPADQMTGTFSIATKAVASRTTVSLTASVAGGSKSASATLTLVPLVPSLITVSPSPAVAGFAATGTVTLNFPTVAGATVALSSSDTTVAAVPASVNVAAGSNSATFSITIPDSGAGKSVTISATLNGVTVKSTIDVVGILSSVTVSPATLLGGQPSAGTVNLRIPAPAGGVVVTLTSSNPAIATVPSTVTVPAGSSSKAFAISTTKPATDTTVVITAASHGVSVTTNLYVVSAIRTTLAFKPNPVKGGQSSTGTLTLNAPAPAGGITITLASSDTTVARVPASITLAAGALQKNFAVATSVVALSTDVTISAAYGGLTTNGTLTVLPLVYPNTEVFKPNPACSNSFTVGTLTLNSAAPAGGATVTLTSSNTAVATVPASVYVPAGALSATYTVTTKDVPVDTAVTITATYAGASKAASLGVKASVLTSAAITPANVKGGTNITLTINLSCPAGAAGAAVSLKSSDTSVLNPPATVTVPAGKTAANFVLPTQSVGATSSVTLTATYNGVIRSATVTVVP